MKFPQGIPIYGDQDYRGDCPPEMVEQASFFAKLRREYSTSWGVIALHPRNEGLVVAGQFQAVQKYRLEGMSKGASDIVVPGARGRYGAFICELKRQDHTKSKWQDGQIEYLNAAKDCGAFACVALGAAAAWQAFGDYLASGN